MTEERPAAPPAALVRAATSVLGATGLVALAGLGVSLSRARTGLGLDQLLFYSLLPAGVVGWVVLTLWRGSPGTKAASALLAVTVVLSVLAAETFATLALRAQDREARTLLIGASIADQARALRLDGVRAYPTVPGNVLVDEDVTLLIDSVPTNPVTTAPGGVTAVLCSERGVTVTFEADRFGFNNPDGVWDEPADVLLVGDSFTQGVCVVAEDQIAGVLREDRRVVNLGNKGSGPIQQLATLREYGALTGARDVYWIYFEGNDRYDLSGERRRAWLTEYLDPTHRQGLAARTASVSRGYGRWIDSLLAAGPSPAEAGRPAALGSDVLRLRGLRRLTRFGVLFPPATSPVTIIPDVLERARDDVEGWGGRLHLVYLPTYERYATLVGEGVPGKDEMRDAAEVLGLPFIDLDAAFRRTGRPRAMWTSPGGHLTPEGYRRVAEAIRASLPSAPAPRDP